MYSKYLLPLSAILNGENTAANIIKYSNKLAWSLFLSVLVDDVKYSGISQQLDRNELVPWNFQSSII